MVSIEAVTKKFSNVGVLKVAQTDHYLSGFTKVPRYRRDCRGGKTIKQREHRHSKGLAKEETE